MLVIGLVGGIASGKSLVASAFVELGAALIDADKIGHQVLEEADVKAQILDLWGDSVFESGRVNRSALAQIVFDPSRGRQELPKLEAITHPAIGRRIQSRIIALKSDVQPPAVVLDAPVMFKAGWHQVCDEIVFVDCPLAVRLERCRQRGWDETEFLERESQQLSVDEKRKLASVTIDNSGTKTKTFEQVQNLWLGWRLGRPQSETPETNPIK